MKNKTVAILLALLLGGLGGHQFYLGNNGKGILYLIFCWTFIPVIIAVIDIIILLLMSENNFNNKYNKNATIQPIVQNFHHYHNSPEPAVINNNQLSKEETNQQDDSKAYLSYIKNTDLESIENGNYSEHSYEWYIQQMIKNFRTALQFPNKEDAPNYSIFKQYENKVNHINSSRNIPEINYWDYFSAFLN